MSQVLKPKKGYKLVKGLFGKEIEIPEEWKIAKLETLVDILDSKRIPIKKSEREKRHGKYPYYGASGIIDYFDDYIFDERLLCLAEDGENLRSKVLPIAFTIENKTWVNNHAHVLRVKDNTEHFFLEYFLNYLSLLKYVASTAIPKLNQKDMCSIYIICPEIHEQQKITSILSNMDNLIFNTQKIIDQLQTLKKSQMQKLLTKGINHKKFKKITLYPKYLSTEIPESWELMILSNVTLKIADRDHFTPIYVENGIPIISPKDIDDDLNLKLDNVKYITKEAHEKNYQKTDLKPSDIIFSRIGARLGKAILVNENFYNFSILHSLCQIRSNDKIIPQYLLQFLRGNLIQKRIWVTVQSIGVPDLGLTEIGYLPIFVPPIKEQQKIASILSNIDSQIDSQIQYKEKLEKLKKSLMQNLLTGKVRVTV